MTNPKILFVTYEFDHQISGGIGTVMNGLAKSLYGKIGFDVFLLKWMSDDSFSGDLYENGKTMKSLSGDYLAEIKALIKEHHYSILHILHAGEHLYHLIKFLKEENIKIKVLFSSHSVAKYEKDIRKSTEMDLVNEDYIVNNSDYIHVLNRTAKNWLCESYSDIEKNAEIHIIPNGINYSSVEEKTVPQNKEKIVLCISRWSHGKGIEYLVDAIPYVIKEEPDAVFHIVGRKEESWEYDVLGYVNRIDEKVKAVESHVKVYGWIYGEEKKKLFSKATLLVMPSELEYFPYSILEPVSQKVPVISSRIPSVQELLVEGRDCLMYEVNNSKELAEKIIYLLRNKAEAEALAASAYESLNQKYTWDIVSELYCGLYRHIMIQNS